MVGPVESSVSIAREFYSYAGVEFFFDCGIDKTIWLNMNPVKPMYRATSTQSPAALFSRNRDDSSEAALESIAPTIILTAFAMLYSFWISL